MDNQDLPLTDTIMESKKPLIIVLVLAILAAGFFAFKSMNAGKGRAAEQEQIAALELAVQEKEQLAQAEAKKAALANEARRLAEANASKNAAAESAQLAEIATLKAREQEALRQAAAAKQAAEREKARLAADKTAIEAESNRIKMLREKESAEAATKLKSVQDALARSESQKRQEIATAREQARQEAITEMEARAAARGQMAMTEVVSKDRASSPTRSTAPKIFRQKTNTNRLQPSYILFPDKLR